MRREVKGRGDLMEIPGVGKAISSKLNALGIRSVRGLKGKDPERLFARYSRLSGRRVDRCLLYVFRASVYYASNDVHDPELLKWWKWVDKAEKKRCGWPSTPLMTEYHDKEWGVPLHDDKRLFEFLVLEGAQAGLSWETVLKKRESYRSAFSGFDPVRLSRLKQSDIESLVKDPGIIRNRLKVVSPVTNARRFIEVQKEFGSFDKYVWSFVRGRPLVNRFKDLSELPATTPESDVLSRDLKGRGFKFTGSTICYAFMQAVGMVNDHLVDCFRYKEIKSMK